MIRVAALLMYCLLSMMWAQGGANYSAFGLGQQRTTFGASYEALAGAAHAVPSDYVFGIANPALWVDVKTTRVQGGYRFNQQRIEQNGTSTAQNNGKLDGAALLFAIDTGRGIAASVGVFPSGSINYASQRRFQVTLPEIGVLDGSTTYRGGGGMVTAYAGGAVRLSQNVSVGAAFLYGFGLISDQIETDLLSESSQRAVSTSNDRLETVGFRAGFSAAIAEGWRGALAVTFFQPLQIERTLIYQSFPSGQATPSFDTSFARTMSSSMPMTIGGGLSYTLRRWLVTLDGEWSATHAMTYRYSPIGEAGDSYRASIAVHYRGSRSAGATFDDKLGVGGGVYAARLPVVISGRPLDEIGASVGLQIPFGGAAMIDAALTAGIRGRGLPVREEFFRLAVTISVGEVWFVPFRR
ncbi:MAG: hypothetical protein N2663_01310 [Chlorobi bacterium]|nr:hypothetical protein [Chlorobiota bacterium]